MRILIVNRALGTLFGGAESFDSNAARYLMRVGHNVKLLTGKPVFGRPKNVFSDLDVVYATAPGIRRLAYATERIHNKLSAVFYHLDLMIFERQVLRWLSTDGRYQDYDVVQVCGLFGLAKQLLERWQIPTIGWLPGIPSGLTRKRIKKLTGMPGFRLFSRGDPVRFMKQRMGLDVVTVEPGLDLEAITQSARDASSARARLNIPQDAALGVTVTRLIPVKNIELLLDALARATPHTPDLHHLVIGDGPLRSALERRARSLNIHESVHFVGHQSPGAVHGILAECDFFVLPSHYESFSIAALEAMAHGLPVVATQVGYLEDLVRDSGAGVTVPAGDVDALSGAILDMATDGKKRKECATRGKEFTRRFAWPAIAAKLEALYDEARGVEPVG